MDRNNYTKALDKNHVRIRTVVFTGFTNKPFYQEGKVWYLNTTR